MEDVDGEDLGTPFWIQSTTSPRLRRRVSSLFFSSGLVVFLLLVTALFFLVFVVPSTLSFSSQIFRPNSVKKSWDSLNIVLVLVAVVFGFLSRIKNEDSYYDEFQASPNKINESQKSNPSTPNKWYNYNTIEGQKSNLSTANQWYEYSDYQTKMENKNSVLTRNSSSYPDLREYSSTRWDYGDYHRRFYDDNVVVGRVSDPGQLHRRHRSLEDVDGGLRALPVTNAIFVDTLVSHSMESTSFQPSSSPPPSVPAQPPAEPPVEVEEKPKTRTFESVTRRKERPSRRLYKDFESMNPVTVPKPPLPSPSAQLPELQGVDSPEYEEKPMCSSESAARRRETPSRNPEKEMEPMDPISTPPSPPPPPPPQQKSSKSERKRGGATGSATKDFLNSLYHKKKKKPRQKSVENIDSLLHQAEAPLSFQIPPLSPPPPPPPPPPPSVFQNLFSSKKHKRKRTITVTLAATELPQAPLPAPSVVAREPNPTSQTAPPVTNQKPPKPMKMKFEKFDETSYSGGESPLNRIPPPPPPPPPGFFKNPAWKFVVQGDYVRIDSGTSSRSGSPDLDDVDSDVTPSASESGSGTPFHPSPLYCPSPDVNTKAESFITNFRAKLKLEKIHSMKREVGLSSLGPRPGPSQI